MSTNHRVLSRMGARQLTQNGLEQIAGGDRNTHVSLVLTGPVSNPDTGRDFLAHSRAFKHQQDFGK